MIMSIIAKVEMSIKKVAIMPPEWRGYGEKGHFYNEQQGNSTVGNSQAGAERRANAGRGGRIPGFEFTAGKPDSGAGKIGRYKGSNTPFKGSGIKSEDTRIYSEKGAVSI